MDTPQFSDGQFVNGSLLNTAMSSLFSDLAFIGKELHTGGLLSTTSLTITPSNLILTIQAPAPFAVLFGAGYLVGAHGTVAGADTTTYTLNMASFVPGSGSQTAYVLAQYTTVGENAVNVVGPPPGHPDYDPTFNPFQFYVTQRDSLTIFGSLTAPDNVTTFELCRITLNSGQSIITAGEIDTSHQVYASAVLDPLITAGAYNGGAALLNAGTDGRITSLVPTYSTDTGSVNALKATLSPGPSSLASILGVPIRVKVAHANTGAATLQVNSLTATSIVNGDGTPLLAGQLPLNGVAELVYDGTNFELLNPIPGYHPGLVRLTGSGTWTVPAGVYLLKDLKVRGAGGAGGTGGSGTNVPGSGGGSGGLYWERNISVTPGQVLPFSCGSGGAATGNTSPGGAGGDSSITIGSNTYTGHGGSGGTGGAQGAYAGGAGGVGGGTFGINGSQGETASASANKGGYGAPCPLGGGPSTGSSGISGGSNFPGGGGAGGGSGVFGGSNGANGCVDIEW